jgi:general secretion pathway protein B
MSYILEALKKADRERNLAKVPTLTTVQLPVHVTRRRAAMWAVAIVFVGGGLAAWLLWVSLFGVSTPRVGSGAGVEAGAPVESLALDRVPSQPVPEAVTRPGVTPVPTGPPVATPRDASRRPEPEIATTPRATRTETPQPSRPRPPSPAPATSSPAPETPASPVQRLDASRQPETEQAPSVQATGAPPSSPVRATLREASSKLSLDVFVYTDVEADRMVIISGKRYIKGQLVEGLFLLEDITPDGAVLSLRDERIVLRP